jgi:P27 family predicted phage terminase small subunit
VLMRWAYTVSVVLTTPGCFAAIRVAVTAYCEAWATYREALERVRAEGLTITNPKTGMAQKNPALNAVEQAGLQLLRYGQQFGLTPAAEVNLASPMPRDSDADDDSPFTQGGAS